MNQTVRIESTYQGAMLSVDLYVTDCAACGIVFATTRDFEQRRRDDGKSFWCPSGHSMTFGKGRLQIARDKAARLEKEKARLEEERSFYQEQLRGEREGHKRTSRQLASTKGQLTKTRRRAAAQLCPVEGCKRHFVQMERHLASKHPDYVPNDVT